MCLCLMLDVAIREADTFTILDDLWTFINVLKSYSKYDISAQLLENIGAQLFINLPHKQWLCLSNLVLLRDSSHHIIQNPWLLYTQLIFLLIIKKKLKLKSFFFFSFWWIKLRVCSYFIASGPFFKPKFAHDVGSLAH